MVELQDYSFTYDGKREILKNINLKIGQGEFIVITGYSGCGKTTLTRVLNGLCPHFYPGMVSGNYFIDGRDAKYMSISELSKYWGSVFQDPRSQFLSKRVFDELVLAMENACMDREEMKLRLNEVVAELGLEGLLAREMMELSSGEKQKVAIGSVFSTYPEGFVLDEPSANLDSLATKGLADFLKDIKAKGHSVVVSEHRLHYLKDLIDRLLVMKNGEIVSEFSADELKNLSPSDLAGMGLRSLILPDLKPGRVMAVKDGFLSCNGLSLVREGQRILDGINLELERGRVHVIVGENGAGKSSICKIITGLYKQTEGSVSFCGKIIKRKERFKRTFFVGQDVDYQLYGYSIRNEFRIGNKKIKDDAIIDCLKEIDLQKSLDTHPQILSGGEKQRLIIGVAHLSDREIIVLDEPTSGLDGYHMKLISGLIRNLAEQGKTVIVITHDVEFISLVADSILLINRGKIQYHRS